MTSATEKLRKLLDELGIEHTDASYKRCIPITVWTADGAVFCYVEGFESTDLHIDNATPEQAIAATLDDGEYEAKMDALLSRLTNGKFSKSRAYDLDFMESCVNEEFEELYAKELADAALWSGTLTAEQIKRIHDVIEKHWHDLPAEYDMPEATALPEYSYDWQAIADELNARAERTCHAESDLSEWVCSACQCWIPLGLTPENIKHASEWRYCPHCGARVKARNA